MIVKVEIKTNIVLKRFNIPGPKTVLTASKSLVKIAIILPVLFSTKKELSRDCKCEKRSTLKLYSIFLDSPTKIFLIKKVKIPWIIAIPINRSAYFARVIWLASDSKLSIAILNTHGTEIESMSMIRIHRMPDISAFL